MEFESDGWNDLLGKMKTVISQVQRQAFIALHTKDYATNIFLLAACGPFWTYVFASREEIEALTSETTSDQEELSDFSEQLDELEVRVTEEAEKLELEKAQEQDEDEDLVQPAQEDVRRIPSFEMTRDHLFGREDNNDLEGLWRNNSTELLESHILDLEEIAEASLKASLPWSDVMVTGSATSNKAINTVRDGINLLMNEWADAKKNRRT